MLARAPFYRVDPAAHLFASPTNLGFREQPEEAVRQWCAFELIRAYGYAVGDMTFEQQAKVGSKSYRIDILVRRHGAPWIVIECKEPKHGKPAVGLEQAISYADAQAIRAEFAVYTNGTTWNVSRRVDHRWVPVLDIPSSTAAESDGSIDDLLLTMQKIQPILHTLDERIEGAEARILLGALQVFFHGPNLLTAAVDQDLRFGTDCLLRVLSTGVDNRHYARSKLGAAAHKFEEFRLRSGIGHELPALMDGEHVGQYMSQLMASLAAMIESTAGNIGVDALVVRLNIALLDYGRDCALAQAGYPPVTPQINEALRGFLSHAFATRLNIRLPNSLDAILTSDMKSFCGPAWDRLVEEERREAQEIRRDFVAAVFSWLRFWRRKD